MEEYSPTLEVDHEVLLGMAVRVVVTEDIPPVVLQVFILRYHLLWSRIHRTLGMRSGRLPPRAATFLLTEILRQRRNQAAGKLQPRTGETLGKASPVSVLAVNGRIDLGTMVDMVTAGKTEAAERLPAMDPEEEISVVITTTAEALDRELVQIIGIIKRQVFSQNQQHRVLQLPRSSKLLELVISLVYCHQFFFFFRFSAFSVSSQSYCPYFILHTPLLQLLCLFIELTIPVLHHPVREVRSRSSPSFFPPLSLLFTRDR